MAPTSACVVPRVKNHTQRRIDRSIDVARRRSSLVARHVPFHHGRITTTMLPRAFHRVCVVGSRRTRARDASERSLRDRSDGTIRKTRVSGCGRGIADAMRPRRTSLARRAAMRDASCGTSTMLSVVRRPSVVVVVRRRSSSVERERRRVTTRGLPPRARARVRGRDWSMVVV